MKIVVVACALVFLGHVVPSRSLSADSGRRATLAIFDFAPNNTSAGDAASISQFVRDAVVKNGTYAVVDKLNMERLLKEQAFQLSGCTSQDCAVRLGRLLSVQRVVTGAYSMFEGQRSVSGMVVNVETGEIEKSHTIQFGSAGEVLSAIETLVRALIAGGEGRTAVVRSVGSGPVAPLDQRVEGLLASQSRLSEHQRGCSMCSRMNCSVGRDLARERDSLWARDIPFLLERAPVTGTAFVDLRAKRFLVHARNLVAAGSFHSDVPPFLGGRLVSLTTSRTGAGYILADRSIASVLVDGLYRR